MEGFDSGRRLPPDLKTGDILLFSGRGGVSTSIKWATQSPWTHVGLVIAEPGRGFPCLWEASRDTNIDDLDSGHARPGVQLVPLQDRLREYEGRVALRRLLDVELGSGELQALAQLRAGLVSRPYRDSKLELMAAGYARAALRLGAAARRIVGLPEPQALRPVQRAGQALEQAAGVFCSELVAQAYQELGLIRCSRRGRPAHLYTPADFSERGEHLPWLRGRLGPELPLKPAPRTRRRRMLTGRPRD